MKIRPILIAGNKRSGSSNLRQLLNFHPNIYMMPESDVFWILYLYHNDMKFINYDGDSPAGMNKTIDKFGWVLNKDKSPYENFINLSREYFKHDGFNKNFENVLYIGDQKPYQHSDPRILSFIEENFDTPKYIHLVRHPFNVVLSAQKFLGDGGFIWKNKKEKELLESWEFYEKRAIQVKKEFQLEYFLIRYEDIIFNERKTLSMLFHFLELEVSESVWENIKAKNYKNLKYRKRLPVSDSLEKLLNDYNYKKSDLILENRLIVYILNKLFYIEKKIKHPGTKIVMNSSKY